MGCFSVAVVGAHHPDLDRTSPPKIDFGEVQSLTGPSWPRRLPAVPVEKFGQRRPALQAVQPGPGKCVRNRYRGGERSHNTAVLPTGSFSFRRLRRGFAAVLFEQLFQRRAAGQPAVSARQRRVDGRGGLYGHIFDRNTRLENVPSCLRWVFSRLYPHHDGRDLGRGRRDSPTGAMPSRWAAAWTVVKAACCARACSWTSGWLVADAGRNPPKRKTAVKPGLIPQRLR